MFKVKIIHKNAKFSKKHTFSDIKENIVAMCELHCTYYKIN